MIARGNSLEPCEVEAEVLPDDLNISSKNLECSETVSFHSKLPSPLQEAMVGFIEKHPNWDQYRLIQAALAGFLVQNGINSRVITRLYIGNMFNYDSFLRDQ